MRLFVAVLSLFVCMNLFSVDNDVNRQKFILNLLNSMLEYSSNTSIDLGLNDVIDKENYLIKPKDGLNFAVKIGIAANEDIIDDKSAINFGQINLILFKTLEYIENKAYGADFAKEHLYYYKTNEFQNKIKNINDIPDIIRESIVVMYARGIIDVDKNGYIDINKILSDKEIQETLSLIIFNKRERQNRELKRYLEIFSGIGNNYTYDPNKDSFYIKLETSGSELPVQTSLTIDKDGKVTYQRSAYEYGGSFKDKVYKTEKINKKKVNELFDFILNKNYFFLLPSDMSTEVLIMDSSTEYITIEYNGKTRKIGGYHPYDNEYFNAIVDMIDKTTKSIRSSR